MSSVSSLMSRDGSCSTSGMGALRDPLRERILALFAEEGDRAGSEFRTEERARRLANLVDKGDIFRRAIVLPAVLEGVRHVLGPRIKLSSLNARSADPHTDVGQPLHVDMGAIPDELWLLGVQHDLDARRFHTGQRPDADGAGLPSLGNAPAGRAG